MKKEFFKIGKLSGRATAAVLCCCLAAAAAFGVYNYNKTRLIAEKQLTGTSDAAVSEMKEENAVDVRVEQKNIPKAELPVQDLMPENADDVFADSPADAEDEPVSSEDSIPAEPVAAPAEDAAETAGPELMIRPLDGELINPYSNGDLVKSKTLNVWRTHDGIDISGEIGENVRAAASGTVCRIYRDAMWGNCIEIEHTGGYRSCYYGLGDDICVSENDPVNAGTVIGTVGESAECEYSEKPHLHFAIRKNGSWTDPAAVVSGEGS